jgi:YD repeat-containing protein
MRLVVILAMFASTAAWVCAADTLPMGSSARGTRVDWQGVFMGETSPTGDGETDRKPVRTEVDVFSMLPTYSTADITLPMRGGELSVEFRRRCMSYTHNLRGVTAGAPPPTSAAAVGLGPGWTSNLAANITVLQEPIGGAILHTYQVQDEDGATYSYLTSAMGTPSFKPRLINSFDNRSITAQLIPEDTNTPPNAMTLVKPHGLTLRFQRASNIVINGAISGSIPVLYYYRLDAIADRNGNQVKYVYDIAHDATATGVGIDGHTPGVGSSRGPNGDHLPTAIYDVRNSWRRIDFSWGYHTGWDMNATWVTWNRPDFVGTFNNVAYLYRTPWRLRKAAGVGNVEFQYNYSAPASTSFPTSIPNLASANVFVRGTLESVDQPAVPVDTGSGTTNKRPQVRFGYEIMPVKDRSDYVRSDGLLQLMPGNEYKLLTNGGYESWSPYEGINILVSLNRVTDSRNFNTTLAYTYDQRPVSSHALAAYSLGISPSYWMQVRPTVSSITTPVLNANGSIGSATANFFPGSMSPTLLQSSVTDVRGNATQFRFEFAFKVSGANNGFGAYEATKLTRTHGSASVVHEYSANVNRNLVKVTDMNGVVTTYAYASGIADDNFDKPLNPALPYDSFSNPRRYEVFEKPYSRTVAGAQTTIYRYRTISGVAPAVWKTNLLEQQTDPSGVVSTYEFDARGNRITETVAGGGLTRTSSQTYDGDGEVTSMTDPDQRKTSIAYDITPATGETKKTTTAVGYNSQPFNATERFSTIEVTDAYGRLVSRTSPRGGVTTWTYDKLGRQATETLPAPASTAQSFYDEAGNRTRHIDHNGNCTIMTYDVQGNPRQVRRRMESPSANSAADIITSSHFDAAGLRLSDTDGLGRVTSYTYDNLLRLTTKTLPEVNLDPAAPSPYTAVETYIYGANAGAGTWTIRTGWNPTRIIGADGVVVDRAYDSFYRQTREVRRIGTPPTNHADAARAGEPSTSTVYNAANNPVTITTLAEAWNGTALVAEDRVVYIYYDGLQRKTLEVLDMDGATAPLTTTQRVNDGLTQAATLTGSNRATAFAYDQAGNVRRVRDATGAVTETVYDGAGRPLRVIQPTVPLFLTAATGTQTVETNGAPTVENAYDKHLLKRVRDANGTWTEFTHDARDRIVTTILDVNGDGAFSSAFAGVDRVEVKAYDALGNVTATTDSLGNTVDTEYDRAGRPFKVLAPAVANAERNPAVSVRPVTTTTYDKAGNVIRITDARGVITENSYDAWNRPTKTERFVDPDLVTAHLGKTETDPSWEPAADANGDGVVNATDSTIRMTTQTKYNADGDVEWLTQVNDAASGGDQKTTYEYDDLRRKTKEVLPAVDAQVRQTVWKYTRNGDAYERIEPNGQYTRTTMNRAGQPATLRIHAIGGTLEETRTFAYDGAGRVLTVTDAAGTSVYTYDAIGRQRTESRTNTGETVPTVVSSRYDAAGNRTWVDYPGAPVPYSLFTLYDRASRATSVIEVIAGTVKGTTGYTYDANGNRKTQANANGTTTTFDYDALNRNTASTTLDGTTPILSTVFAFDLVGNRVSMSERLPNMADRIVSYAYDFQYRLVREIWR